jgi:hypothetical protein
MKIKSMLLAALAAGFLGQSVTASPSTDPFLQRLMHNTKNTTTKASTLLGAAGEPQCTYTYIDSKANNPAGSGYIACNETHFTFPDALPPSKNKTAVLLTCVSAKGIPPATYYGTDTQFPSSTSATQCSQIPGGQNFFCTPGAAVILNDINQCSSK